VCSFLQMRSLLKDMATDSGIPSTGAPLSMSTQNYMPPMTTTVEVVGSTNPPTSMRYPVPFETPGFYWPEPVHVQNELIEKPMIIRETIVPSEKVQIQPVIHRHREIPEYHEVIQPMKETHIAPTEVRQVTMESEYRPEVRAATDANFENRLKEVKEKYAAQSITTELVRETVMLPPIVRETTRKRIVEEIQPIIYREIIRPVVITQVQPIYEQYVENPSIIEEVSPAIDLAPCQSQPL